VVTRPFDFEGKRRAENAQAGIEALRQEVDTLIVVPNQKLVELQDDELILLDAFAMADDILRAGVQGISDLITEPGLINLDFADVKAVMQGAGTALMGIGTAKGEDRAVRAAEQAINHPLLESSIDNARGVLMHYAAASNMKLAEITQAGKLIQEVVHPTANIIFGTSVDNTLGDEIRITVIAAGFDEQAPRPSVRQTTFAPAQVDPVAAEPVVEESLVQTNWFGAQTGAVPVVTDTVSIPEPTVVPDPVDSIQERRETSFFGRRREAKKFDDGFDFPDFIKNPD